MHPRLAQRLKRLRKLQGLSQEGLARKAGLSLGFVQRLEYNMHDPSLSTLKKLAKALGIKVGDLLK